MDRRGAGAVRVLVIPRLIHQIWLGPSELPEAFAAYARSWRRHHPDWRHELWTEESLPAGLRPEAYQRLRAPAERSDIIRYELLRRFGGVYVDSDFECLRPLDPLLDGLDFFVAEYRGGRVNNAIIGATPDHRLVGDALRELRPRATWGPVDKSGTGPLLLDRVVRGSGARIFPRPLFYPEWHERHDAVAYHHMSRSWKDEAGLRRSIELAEGRRDDALRTLARLERPSPTAALPAQIELQHWIDELRPRARRNARRLRRGWSRSVAPLAGRSRTLLPPSGRPVSVPRTLHYLRLSDGSRNAAEAARADSWRLAHRGWHWREWSDENLPAGLRPEIYDRLRPPTEREDLLMLELLAREGGVAVSSNVMCRRRIDSLADGQTAFAAGARDGTPTTTVVGATAEHSAIARALEVVEPLEWFSPVDPCTGSEALTRVVAEFGALHVLPARAFDPKSLREHLLAYGVVDPRPDVRQLETLRAQLLDAEARQHEAEDALQVARAG